MVGLLFGRVGQTWAVPFTITQLTDDSSQNFAAQVSGSNVVWEGGTGSRGIFFFDGVSTTQLTDDNFNDGRPQISDSNVVWSGLRGVVGDINMSGTVEADDYTLWAVDIGMMGPDLDEDLNKNGIVDAADDSSLDQQIWYGRPL